MLGALAFTVGGSAIFMTAREARATNVPFRVLSARQGEMIGALGEALVPKARESGIAHFVDQQLSVPAEECLLSARIFNLRPPFIAVYDGMLAAVEAGSIKAFGRSFLQLTTGEQYEFIDRMRQNKVDGWQGPPGASVYSVIRADAVDVVYGTMEGYADLGIPYMAHIEPEKRW